MKPLYPVGLGRNGSDFLSALAHPIQLAVSNCIVNVGQRQLLYPGAASSGAALVEVILEAAGDHSSHPPGFLDGTASCLEIGDRLARITELNPEWCERGRRG